MLKTKENQRRLALAKTHSALSTLSGVEKYASALFDSKLNPTHYLSEHSQSTFSNPLRIAICVSGQLRNYQDALNSWKNLGLGGHDCRYFVHTWSYPGQILPVPPYHKRILHPDLQDVYEDTYRKLGLEGMRLRYPKFFSLWDWNNKPITESELRATYSPEAVEISDETAPEFTNWSNAEKMYYSISRANELAKRSGDTFDLVIRIRPDLIVEQSTCLDWQQIHEDLHRTSRILTDSHGNSGHGFYVFPNLGLCVGDQFAVANPEVMDRYASTYKRYKASNLVMEPHSSLANTLLENGIQVKVLELGSKLSNFGPPLDKQLESLFSDIQSDSRIDYFPLDKKIYEIYNSK
jgi:hypothetical protein